MSSKGAGAMSEENKSALVPRRRFPEFQGDAWEAKPLEQVAPLQRGFDLPSSELQPGDIPVVYSNGVQSFHCTAMAKAPGLVTGRSGTIGKLHFIEKGEYWPHNTSLWVTSFKGNVPKFVYFLFNSIGMERFASGSGVPTLNRNDVHAFVSAVPKSLTEQQKIADFLSSLDELITAETQKLDALKAHKKGLMQRLFPRDGEAVPRLRFPDFRGAREWDAKTLSELAENLDNRRIPVTESDRIKGVIPYYGASGIVDYIHDFIFDEDLLCVSEDGANLVARTTPIAFSISGKTWVNNHAHVLKFDCRCVQKIVEDYLNSVSLEDYLTGMAQPKLNRAMLDTIHVPVPQDEDEQEAVAGCLSSLDGLITAQSQKIDALNSHKKGLMQQLFPVLDEVRE